METVTANFYTLSSPPSATGRSGDRILVGGRDFPHRPYRAWGTIQPPYKKGSGSSSGRGKRGWGVALTTHTPPRAEVKGVELRLCSPCVPSW